MSIEQRCFIWPTEDAEYNSYGEENRFRVDSSRCCGGYVISHQIVLSLKEHNDFIDFIYGKWIRREERSKRKVKHHLDKLRALYSYEIWKYRKAHPYAYIDLDSMFPELKEKAERFETASSIEDILEEAPLSEIDKFTPSIHERGLSLLKVLKNLTVQFGQTIIFFSDNKDISNEMMAASCSVYDSGLTSIIRYLEAKGYLETHKRSDGSFSSLTLLAEGFEHPEKTRPKKTKSSDTPDVAVMMEFSSEGDSRYKKIKDVFEKLRKEGCKINKLNDSSVIPQEQITPSVEKWLRESPIVICDFTGLKGNVYYEFGYAKASEADLICICDEKDFNKLPFHIKNYQILKFKNTSDLEGEFREKLRVLLEKHELMKNERRSE